MHGRDYLNASQVYTMSLYHRTSTRRCMMITTRSTRVKWMSFMADILMPRSCSNGMYSYICMSACVCHIVVLYYTAKKAHKERGMCTTILVTIISTLYLPYDY